VSWPRVGAWAAVVVTAVLLSADVWVVTLAGRAPDRWLVLLALTISVGSSALGLLVVRRQPANCVGTVLCAMGGLFALTTFSDIYPVAAARRADVLPRLPDIVAAVVMNHWIWLYVAVALLMLTFPDGQLLSRRWRGVAVGLVGVGLALQVLMPLLPGPYDPPYDDIGHPFGELSEGSSRLLTGIAFPAFVALLLVAGFSSWLRYQSGGERLQAQLKWFALVVVAFMPLTLALSWAGYWVLGTHDLAGIGLNLMYAGLPLVTAIAIFKHDLYDVDWALSTTVTYAVVTGALVGVFGLASFGTGLLLGRGSSVAAAAVTASAGALAIPLVGRLRRVVDRRVYPLRSGTLSAVEDLKQRIDAGAGTPEELESVLRRTLRDPHLSLAIIAPGGAPWPDGEQPGSFPVLLAGHQVGTLSSGGPASPRLLREVASSAAMLVELVRLRREATRALQEAESSRARLQQVGYEERRKLERDLHDGAQQRLVSLGLALRLAQRHVATGNAAAQVLDGLLDEWVGELGRAVGELRDLAHGLRPSCLDDGLHPALTTLVDAVPLPVELDVSAGGSLPDDVATTAYYVAAEAVANAVKHSQAGRLELRVARVGDSVRVRVHDDGCGGAVIRDGSGLAGIRDRVAAAGGRLRVLSPAGQGTLVEAELPCES
jgi:signal transduction histidine kinase